MNGFGWTPLFEFDEQSQKMDQFHQQILTKFHLTKAPLETAPT
jgi:hypothetical protein